MEMATLSPTRPVSSGSSTAAKSQMSPTAAAAYEHFSPTTTGNGAARSVYQAAPFRPGKDLSKGLLEVEVATITGVNHRKILLASDAEKAYLPGQPRIRLLTKDATGRGGRDISRAEHEQQATALGEYLKKCHLTKEIDKLVGWWMEYIFVQTPSHKHVTTLGHQASRSRKIIVDEHPGLHLLWYYEQVWIKPIPAYFYSEAFWDYLYNVDSEVYAASVGFMRSWYHLVQYESDYMKAIELKLIPNMSSTAKPSTGSSSTANRSANSPSTSTRSTDKQCTACNACADHTDGKPPTYVEFCEFIAPFGSVLDKDVNPRYTYGELRMTRINKTAFFQKFQLAYFHTHPQWGNFLGTVLGPVFTVFVILSVVLNSMQVTLSAMGADMLDPSWKPYVAASVWFPVVVICMIAAVIAISIGGLLYMTFKDMFRTKQLKRRKKKGDTSVGEKSHGMIW